MSYCDAWRLIGLMIGLSPLAGFIVAVIVGRLSRRLIWGLLLGAIAGVATSAALRVAGLVLWNGIRPAVCN